VIQHDSMKDPVQLLCEIEDDLRSAHAEPPRALDEFLEDAARRLGQLPAELQIERRITALIEIGSLSYLHGDTPLLQTRGRRR